MSSSKGKKRSWSLQVPSSKVINLIQHHLVENGLRESSAALLAETQIGCSGLLQHAHAHAVKRCREGDWGSVLETLSLVTFSNDDGTGHIKSGPSNYVELNSVLAAVHEMAILELADASEMDLAFATLKSCREFVDERCRNDKNIQNSETTVRVSSHDVWSNNVERRLHEIQALRSVRAVASEMALTGQSLGESQQLLPPDYYGPNNISKEQRRNDIAKRLAAVIPIIPSSRLVSLLQQAIKWQVHTGEMPMIQEIWEEEEDQGIQDVVKEAGNKRKKSKKKKHFDLVVGNVCVENATSDVVRDKETSQSFQENIPVDPYSTLKFGKNTFVTSCIFYCDSNLNQTSLITGTSDGFIEIWDEETKYTKLRMDLDYQKKGEIMCHDTVDDHGNDIIPPPSILAMAVNTEGTILATGDSKGSIIIWNLQTGLSLLELEQVHSGAIHCLDFSSDGSKILSGSQDGTCREFGLRTKRMLKEFRGHTSFVNCCRYLVPTKNSTHDELLIVTASADSTVRVWCGRSAEERYALNPVNAVGQNVLVSRLSTSDSANSSDLEQNIHTVIPLHTPANTLVIIPRGKRAFLVTLSGLLLKTYENESTADESGSNAAFVCGTVSPSNKWLYLTTGSGVCLCYDLGTGKLQKRINDFGLETTRGKADIEISSLVHHPLKGIIAAYSSSVSQKKGLLTLWK